MANTRQYVGARYVIKVYENSVTPSSAEWEADTYYEPLVMVTYNNSSYLSKKEVPATVGDPVSNPEYWVVTGAYNGQIAYLQSQIDTINNTVIPAINADIADIVSELTRMKKLSRKNVVWIGDSYGDESSEHPALINNIVGFNSFYNLSTGSTGFTGKEGSADYSVNLEWKTILKNWVDAQTQETLDSIDDVYISGGFNDVYATSFSTIGTFIQQFMAYAKSVLVNAEFHLVFCGWCGGMTGGDITTPTETAKGANFRFRLANKVLPAYANCAEYGMEFMGHCLNALHNYEYCFESDGYHPSSTGQGRLARQILNYMLGGRAITYSNYIDGNPRQPLTLTTQYGISPYYTVFTCFNYDDNQITFRSDLDSNMGLPYTAPSNIGARTHHTIGTWRSTHLLPVMDGVAKSYYTIPVQLQTASGLIPADLTFYPGGTLDIYPWEAITSGTSFYIILGNELTMKLWEC